MSIHPSLGAAVKGKQQKSVLKRTERIKHMMNKGLWKEDAKVFGLPKIKALRIKIKKEKVEKAAEEGATPAAPGAAPQAASADKKAAPKK
ncbi:MAG TPA: small basic protein [Candidatus Omnitrophota bacterium]|nr:small basic protein [Candidatus Omnitrophota bacterium]